MPSSEPRKRASARSRGATRSRGARRAKRSRTPPAAPRRTGHRQSRRTSIRPCPEQGLGDGRESRPKITPAPNMAAWPRIFRSSILRKFACKNIQIPYTACRCRERSASHAACSDGPESLSASGDSLATVSAEDRTSGGLLLPRRNGRIEVPVRSLLGKHWDAVRNAAVTGIRRRKKKYGRASASKDLPTARPGRSASATSGIDQSQRIVER